MSLLTITSLIVTGATAYVLARPHMGVGGTTSSETAEGGLVLNERRERCLQVLKDLELDYHTNKISEADYRAMKLSTSQELSAVLKELDGHPHSRT